MASSIDSGCLADSEWDSASINSIISISSEESMNSKLGDKPPFIDPEEGIRSVIIISSDSEGQMTPKSEEQGLKNNKKSDNNKKASKKDEVSKGKSPRSSEDEDSCEDRWNTLRL